MAEVGSTSNDLTLPASQTLSHTEQAAAIPDAVTLKALSNQKVHPKVVKMLGARVLAGSGRDDIVSYLKSKYSAPQRLKKVHKDQIKVIKSLDQGYDGSEAICSRCKQRRPINELEVHHLTHAINENLLHQVQPACKPCNLEENHTVLGQKRPSDPAQGERGIGRLALVLSGTGSFEDELNNIPFSSREGMKAAVMRPAYDKWVRHPINGPFCKPEEIAKPSRMHSWNVRRLAEAAPYGCSTLKGKALGSSKTYLKYIREDIEGGILVRDDTEETNIYGWNVRLNFELLEQIRKESGQ